MHVGISSNIVICKRQVQTCANVLVRQAGPCAFALGVPAYVFCQASVGMELQRSWARMLHQIEECRSMCV